MSGLGMSWAEPELADPRGDGFGLAATPAPAGEVFAAALDDPSTPAANIARWGARRGWQTAADLGDVRKLDPAEASARYGLNGALVFNEPTPEPVAQQLYDRKLRELARDAKMARASGVGRAAAFAGSFVAHAVDPLNLATAMVPVVGPTRLAQRLDAAGGAAGRAGVRGVVGAAEGALGNLAVEPFNALGSIEEQRDWTVMEAMYAAVFGAALGAGARAVAGAIGDRAARGAAQPPAATPAEAAFHALPIDTRREALQVASAELVDNGTVQNAARAAGADGSPPRAPEPHPDDADALAKQQARAEAITPAATTGSARPAVQTPAGPRSPQGPITTLAPATEQTVRRGPQSFRTEDGALHDVHQGAIATPGAADPSPRAGQTFYMPVAFRKSAASADLYGVTKSNGRDVLKVYGRQKGGAWVELQTLPLRTEPDVGLHPIVYKPQTSIAVTQKGGKARQIEVARTVETLGRIAELDPAERGGAVRWTHPDEGKAAPAQATQKPAAATAAARRAPTSRDSDELLEWVAAAGGVLDEDRVWTGETKRNFTRFGPALRKNGLSLDDLGERMQGARWFADGRRPTTNEVADLLDRAFRGEKVWHPDSDAARTADAARRNEGRDEALGSYLDELKAERDALGPEASRLFDDAELRRIAEYATGNRNLPPAEALYLAIERAAIEEIDNGREWALPKDLDDLYAPAAPDASAPARSFADRSGIWDLRDEDFDLAPLRPGSDAPRPGEGGDGVARDRGEPEGAGRAEDAGGGAGGPDRDGGEAPGAAAGLDRLKRDFEGIAAEADELALAEARAGDLAPEERALLDDAQRAIDAAEANARAFRAAADCANGKP